MILSRISSWGFGKLTNIKKPTILAKTIIKLYASYFKICLKDVKKDLSEFECLGDFFTRDLKEGARPIGIGLVSPVDGVVTALGEITSDTLIQAKGINYKLSELIPNEGISSKLINRSYICIYLSPKDYHHIHSPTNGTITKSIHAGGALLSVGNWFTQNIKNLYIKNERVISIIEEKDSSVALVMVGAFNVGSITTVYNKLITNENPLNIQKVQSTETVNFSLKKGDRVATFNLGSTVVLITSKTHSFNKSIRTGSTLKQGESL